MNKFNFLRSIISLMVMGLIVVACNGQAPATKPAEKAAAPTEAAPAEKATAPAEKPAEAAAGSGSPENAPDKAGQKITVFDIPKLIGIDYFNATYQGMKEAADELGNISLTQDGPTEGRVDRQIEFIDNAITKKVDVITFASNDPVAITPVLEKALKNGIHVIGYDADSQPQGRQFFVNQATFAAIGKAMVEAMVKEVGEEAQVAIVTSSLTAPNQNAWIDEMKKYRDAHYPKLEFVDVRPSEEDQNLAFSVTQDLLQAYPNLKGVYALSSVAFPGAADGVKQAGKCGKVAVVGLSTPNTMRKFVKEGCVKSVVLWNPVDLGYATIYAARAVVDGKLKPGDTSVELGRLGKLEVKGSEILLGDPFIFNADNIDKFNF